MPKRKAPAPKKLDGPTKTLQTWNLGETPQHFISGLLNASSSMQPDNVPDLIDDSEAGPNLPHHWKKKVRKRSDPLKADEKLKSLIEDCDFYLTLHRGVGGGRRDVKDEPGDNRVVGKLGTVAFKLKDKGRPRELPRRPECWLYIGTTPTYCLYYEWPHLGGGCQDCDLRCTNDNLHVRYYEVESQEERFQLYSSLVVKKYFSLRIEDYNSVNGTLDVSVWLLAAALVSRQPRDYSSEHTIRRPICVTVQHFLGIGNADLDSLPRISKVDIDDLYAAIKNLHQQEGRLSTVSIMHRDLIPTLRPYQMDAVRWMLAREGFPMAQKSTTESLHNLYSEVKLVDGQKLFYNYHGGHLTKIMPTAKPESFGGILADEMGLGKTVEVLACLLLHPRPAADLSDELRTFAKHRKTEEGLREFKLGDLLFSSKQRRRQDGDRPSDSVDKTRPSSCRTYFECICGDRGQEADVTHRKRVQCEKCGLWQHASCVKYDVDNDMKMPYYCPHCWHTMVFPSRATLIVAPSTISYQWLDEIRQHVRGGSLKVLVYHGVYSGGFIQPPTIADHDIVLMTYGTMRKEFDYLDLPHSNGAMGRRLRHPKRFMAVPSPLMAVGWWRICLDEAQMVECPTAKTAALAIRLPAVNRWCITGTPIQKHINDLYGLLLFLGVDPYCYKGWWKEVLLEPYYHGITDPMHKVLSSVLWRTAKKDVLDQINIPAQSDEVHWLSFTPVEEHFYRRQHGECSRDMVAQINTFANLNTKLNSLDRRTFNQLLTPLLRLRQACCHPQVVRGQFVAIRKTTLTMEELLKSLIKKAKIEAEEGHRLLIASLNGLAAIHAINREWAEAVEKYREVLQSAAEWKPQIKTDKLQLLHALHNLSEILEAGHENIPATVRDDSLKQDAKELHQTCLRKCQLKVRESRETLRSATELVAELRGKMEERDAWYLSVILQMETADHEMELVDRVKSELADVSNINSSIAHKFRNGVGLRYLLTTQLDDLRATHAALCKAVSDLDDEPSAEVIGAAVECHLRPSDRFHETCLYCKVHELFNSYESRLFSFDEERIAVNPSNDEDPLMGQLRRGTWADSEVEIALKIVCSFGKQHGVNSTLIEDGQNHIKLFEALKKEFRALRGVWMQLRDQASVIDELNMATIRLRVRAPYERRPDTPQLDVLEPSEVGHHKLKLMSDQIVARAEFQKKVGQLLYLRNLSTSDHGKRGGCNPDPCPICQRTLGEQWSVLQCGHCFCIECIRILVTGYSFGGRNRSLKCAVCRQTTCHGEISYVNTRIEASDADSEPPVTVLGSHSTKVEAVVRKLIQIKIRDPRTKTLVFSSWQDVLDILEKALKENDISFCNLNCHNNKFEENLKTFKYDDDVNVLLMPVQSGANGLNLIEASNVILVEPILNLSSELQALGRVHRIGQTKPTVVHRFLVRGTIEERIYESLQISASNATSHDTEENTLTVKDLLDLFVKENEAAE